MNTNSNISIVPGDVVGSSIVPFDVVNTSMTLSTVNHSSPLAQAPAGEIYGASNGPVAILWDIENCRIPCDTRAEDVAGNIRMALRINPLINGAVTMFNAYGDFNAFPKRLREGCQRTGVKLIDVPNGRKDAADKAILIDMFLFALDNSPPSSIVLISGDVDFAPALHILGQRGYTVILLVPSGVGVSSALSNAGRFVWDWPSVARGEGFMPSPAAMPLRANVPTYMQAGFSRYGQEPQIEEESIVYRGTSVSGYSHSNVNQNYCFDSMQVSRRDFSGLSHSLSEYNNTMIGLSCSPNPKSNNLSSAIYNADEGNRKSYHSWWVQPGDVPALKQQLVKLLELSNGSIQLIRLPPEYHKLFGRQLHVQEYGESKLVNLLSKMNDVLTVEGRCDDMSVCLRKRAGQPKKMAVNTVKKDKRERNSSEVRSKCIDVVCEVNVSSDEKKIKETHVLKVKSSDTTSSEVPALKQQLVMLLELSNGSIELSRLPPEYQKLFGRQLHVQEYGESKLLNLLSKMNDVLAVEGRCGGMSVCLRKSAGQPKKMALNTVKKDKRERNSSEVRSKCIDVVCEVNVSSDEKKIKETHVLKMKSSGTTSSDVPALKQQLVKLLELSNGSMELSRLPPEYHKLFGRQLHVQEYGESKLVNLLSKMNDVLTVEGRCNGMSVCMRKSAGQPKKMALNTVKKDKR